MEAVGRLAGGVAHDFNNLLTVILGYNEMLRDHVRQDAAALEYADEVLHAAERASALTNQLLAFSRRQVAVPRVVDLNEIVAGHRQDAAAHHRGRHSVGSPPVARNPGGEGGPLAHRPGDHEPGGQFA